MKNLISLDVMTQTPHARARRISIAKRKNPGNNTRAENTILRKNKSFQRNQEGVLFVAKKDIMQSSTNKRKEFLRNSYK